MKNVGAWIAAAVGALLAVLLTVGTPTVQAAPSQTDFTALENEIDSAIATFTAADIGTKNQKYFPDHLRQARGFIVKASNDVGAKKQKYFGDLKHAQAQLKIVRHNLSTNRGRKIDATLKAQLIAIADKLLQDWAALKAQGQ